MLVSLWLVTMGASADPVTLPEFVVHPDPFVPAHVVESRTAEHEVPLPPVEVQLTDPGSVTMTLDTVDTAPKRVDEAPDAGETCALTVTVDHRGAVDDVEVVTCDDAKRARRAARQLRFEPGVYQGREVAVADVPVVVSLAR